MKQRFLTLIGWCQIERFMLMMIEGVVNTVKNQFLKVKKKNNEKIRKQWYLKSNGRVYLGMCKISRCWSNFKDKAKWTTQQSRMEQSTKSSRVVQFKNFFCCTKFFYRLLNEPDGKPTPCALSGQNFTPKTFIMLPVHRYCLDALYRSKTLDGNWKFFDRKSLAISLFLWQRRKRK